MSEMTASEKKKEDWMNSKWRPMMGWMYMLVCTADFVVFPVIWSLLQAVFGGQVTSQWNPITLQGAGLFHMAMGAVLGVAAFGRTQEKMAGANNGGISTPSTPAPSFGASSPSSFSAPSTPSFSKPPAPSVSTPKPFAPSSPAEDVGEEEPTPSQNIPRPMPVIKRPGT